MQLRVGLAFVHTPSATEADFLFPEAGGARRKRKHGSDAVQPGRALLMTRQLRTNGDSNIYARSIHGQVVASYVAPGLLRGVDQSHCITGTFLQYGFMSVFLLIVSCKKRGLGNMLCMLEDMCNKWRLAGRSASNEVAWGGGVRD